MTTSAQYTVILANGSFPRRKCLLDILHAAARIVCCDGAASALLRAGLEPDLVVGDLDSLDPALKKRFWKRLVHESEQETNDLAKAFRFVCERSPRPPDALRIAILGATGLREDHALGNIFRLADFAATAPHVVLYTDAGFFEVVRGERTFPCEPGEAVSVFAPTPGTAVSSNGLQWPLDGVSLADLWSGTLNRTTGPSFTLRTDGRPILVYRPYA